MEERKRKPKLLVAGIPLLLVSAMCGAVAFLMQGSSSIDYVGADKVRTDPMLVIAILFAVLFGFFGVLCIVQAFRKVH